MAAPEHCPERAASILAVTLAPVLMLHPGEQRLPADADDFVRMSSLHWRDAGRHCADVLFARRGAINPRRLGSGRYGRSRQSSIACRRPHRRRFASNDLTRPFDGRSATGKDGFDLRHHGSNGGGRAPWPAYVDGEPRRSFLTGSSTPITGHTRSGLFREPSGHARLRGSDVTRPTGTRLDQTRRGASTCRCGVLRSLENRALGRGHRGWRASTNRRRTRKPCVLPALGRTGIRRKGDGRTPLGRCRGCRHGKPRRPTLVHV